MPDDKKTDQAAEAILKSIAKKADRYAKRRAAEKSEPLWGKCIGTRCERQIPLLVFHLARQSGKPLKCSDCGVVQTFPDYKSDEGVVVWMIVYDRFRVATVERVIERQRGSKFSRLAGIGRYVRPVGDGFGFPTLSENLVPLSNAFDWSVGYSGGATFKLNATTTSEVGRESDELSESLWLERAAHRLWTAAHLDMVSQIALLETSSVPTIEL